MAVLLPTNLVSYRSKYEVVILRRDCRRCESIVYMQPTVYRPDMSRSAQTMKAFSTSEWHRPCSQALNGPVPPRNAGKSTPISITSTRKSLWGRSRTARERQCRITVAWAGLSLDERKGLASNRRMHASVHDLALVCNSSGATESAWHMCRVQIIYSPAAPGMKNAHVAFASNY